MLEKRDMQRTPEEWGLPLTFLYSLAEILTACFIVVVASAVREVNFIASGLFANHVTFQQVI